MLRALVRSKEQYQYSSRQNMRRDYDVPGDEKILAADGSETRPQNSGYVAQIIGQRCGSWIHRCLSKLGVLGEAADDKSCSKIRSSLRRCRVGLTERCATGSQKKVVASKLQPCIRHANYTVYSFPPKGLGCVHSRGVCVELFKVVTRSTTHGQDRGGSQDQKQNTYSSSS